MEFYRGDIFYVKKGAKPTGCEQDAGRPAVIVSNDKCNKYAQFVEIVYLTTQKKEKRLPTHVDVLCTIPSIAMCEQIVSVSKDRLDQFVRCCTNEEMEAIDEALLISLDLDYYLDRNGNQPSEPKKAASNDANKDENSEEVKKLKKEVEEQQREIDALLVKNDELYAELCKERNQPAATSDSIRLAIERDLYKQQYEELLERVIAR